MVARVGGAALGAASALTKDEGAAPAGDAGRHWGPPLGRAPCRGEPPALRMLLAAPGVDVPAGPAVGRVCRVAAAALCYVPLTSVLLCEVRVPVKQRRFANSSAQPFGSFWLTCVFPPSIQ